MWLFVLLYCCWNLCYVEALTCLTCQGTQQPRHCRYVEECSENEPVCQNGSIGSHTACRECCRTDLCNAVGCGEPGYPFERGPVCYDCQQTIGDRQCKDITHCQRDEVCNYQTRLEFNDEVTSRGCARKTSCSNDHSPVIVGKRDQDDNDVPSTCDHCCSGDLCNKDCVVEPLETGADCYDLLNSFGRNATGVYSISTPKTHKFIYVYCDMDTDGGGWTVFQHRASADVDFYRNMSDYVHGFGKVSGNFWLGLENVFEILASRTSSLYIKLESADGSTFEEQYANFSLSTGPEYRLHVGQRNGSLTGGHDLSYNNGYPFSTFDDDKSNANCANRDHDGWWHRPGYCTYVNGNGNYTTPGTVSSYHGGNGGMVHYGFRGIQSLKTFTMMFRRQ